MPSLGGWATTAVCLLPSSRVTSAKASWQRGVHVHNIPIALEAGDLGRRVLVAQQAVLSGSHVLFGVTAAGSDRLEVREPPGAVEGGPLGP